MTVPPATPARRGGKLRRRVLKSALRIAGLLSLSLLFLTGCLADRVIFQPPPPTENGPPVEMLAVTPEISIALRFLPPPGPDAYTLLLSHGNAEDLSHLEAILQEFYRRGYGVAAYDYEGYGRSGGKPSEANACRDIEAVYAYLTVEAGIRPEKLVIHGFSVGGGPSCYLAAKVPAAALVLEAPFTSAFAVVRLGFLPFDRFPNLRRIDRIAMPLLIIHGECDRIIPPSHGRKLFARAKEPKRFYGVPGADHNDLRFIAGEEYFLALQRFLRAGAGAPAAGEKHP